MGDQIQIATINNRGIKSIDKRANLYSWISDNCIDITFVQETYCDKIIAERIDREWNGTTMHSLTDSSHSRGVLIFVSGRLTNRADFEIQNISTDQNGRLIAISFKLSGETYYVANMYCPTESIEKGIFIKQCLRKISDTCNDHDNVIIGGDFNIDTSKRNREKKKDIQAFDKFINELEIYDSWKQNNPDKVQYTYIDPGRRGYRSRIDYIFCTTNVLKKINKCQIVQCPSPDHRAVVCVINITQRKRGKGYWKLNSSVLDEKPYDLCISNLIEETVHEYQNILSPTQLWEFLKKRIKEESILYCIKRSKCKQSVIKNLERDMDELDEKLGVNNNDISLIEKRKNIKQQLDAKYTENARGAQIRARAKWVEEGERSSKYFLNLEKKQQSMNVIDSITYNNETYTTDNSILNACKSFYEVLYSSNNIDTRHIDNYLENVNSRALSQEQRDMCESNLTIAECTKAIIAMKSNKTPGIDGLTVNFYKHFWDKLQHIVLNAFNESYNTGNLPDSMRTSIMSLIFKKGPQDDLENYRPISLTNTDYKILAFVLANRIQSVITTLIGPEQLAYIEKRFIGNNIRLVQDVIESNVNGMIFFSDFKKAYDSLEWDFIWKCLEKYNFGPNFIKWIQLLYKNPQVVIKNNGYLSDPVDLKRGVRQGCPVSCLIFILCLECLADKIRSNNNLNGLKLNITNIKLCLYADDITFFVKNEDELKECIREINMYGDVSGLTLNLKKCEGLWIGNYKFRQPGCKVCGINWPTEPIKCLGIFVGHNKNACDELNWNRKIVKMANILRCWRNRDLTIFGKVQIIKSLALPNIIYSANCCDIPNGVIQRINELIYNFVWGSTERIKRNTLISPPNQRWC